MSKSPKSLQKASLLPVQPESRRALVLGDPGTAGRIAQELKELGFAPETAPSPKTVPDLKGLLAAFAERCREEGVPERPLVHPGVNIWAERVELPSLGEELGLDVVCPSPRTLTLFANKLNLLGEADQLGIPHLVIRFDPIYSVREIERLIVDEAQGRKPYPFVLKAVKGGGSLGIQVVQDAGDLERKIPLWLDQLRNNQGEVILFAERYLESARHIVVPFVRFHDGRFETFPFTDASLQCRYRKVIEFCPADAIGPEVEEKIAALAERFAEHCGYVGVGTLEFLVDDVRAYLVEGSPRLNTGFHLWERVAGTNAVAWQLAAHEGYPTHLEPKRHPKAEWASGVALRLYAEDPLLQLPQAGVVQETSEKLQWHFSGLSQGLAAELDLQVQSGGCVLPTDYGMVGMLWAGAPDRKQALMVARGALDETWIAGSLQTNERFLGELLTHPWVKEGLFHAGFVDEEFLPAIRPPAEIFRIFSFVLQDVPGLSVPPAGATVRWAVGDQWGKTDDLDPESAPSWQEGPLVSKIRPGQVGVSGWVRLADGRSFRVCAYPLSETKWQVRVGAWVLPVRRVSVMPGEKQKRQPKLFALIHGQVHSMLYREGSVVPAHEPLLLLESLGVLVPHALPVEVRVVRWKKRAEEIVHAGEELAEFEWVAKT